MFPISTKDSIPSNFEAANAISVALWFLSALILNLTTFSSIPFSSFFLFHFNSHFPLISLHFSVSSCLADSGSFYIYPSSSDFSGNFSILLSIWSSVCYLSSSSSVFFEILTDYWMLEFIIPLGVEFSRVFLFLDRIVVFGSKLIIAWARNGFGWFFFCFSIFGYLVGSSVVLELVVLDCGWAFFIVLELFLLLFLSESDCERISVWVCFAYTLITLKLFLLKLNEV